MHVETFIQESLRTVSQKMHEKRFLALSEMVSAALRGTCLTVTGLGRALGGTAKEKHCIKRADRLLSNDKLLPESTEIYFSMARRILQSVESPTILIDWSTISERNQLFLLRASSPVKGRSLTLYEEVHTLARKESPLVHRKFLRTLQELLPVGCRPVIVTDAGFRTPWFRQVRRLGWDYVGRIRNRHMVKRNGSKWVTAKSFYQTANITPRSLGSVILTRANPICCELVLCRQKARGRMEQTLRGERAKRRQSRKHAEREQEPWLIATSLSLPPQKVIALYKTRMQIEESFRDLKSARYGLSLEFSGTKKHSRMSILLLIASLALWICWLLGKAAHILGLHRTLQANTVRTRNVLSMIFLGFRVVNSSRVRITEKAFNLAQLLLTASVRNYCYES